MANPTLLTMPLCRDADKNTIPATDAGTAGIFSEQYGWQAVNSLPLSAGGKAVQRQDFNGVFALLGGIAYACQRGYTFEWVNNLPYLKGCVITDPLDGNKYNAKNDVPAGGTNPSLDPTNWELFGVVDLSGKANTNLDNLSTDGKQTIIDCNMPDYDNAISYTYDTAYTAQSYTMPDDGYFGFTITSAHTGGYVKVNNVTVSQTQSPSSSVAICDSGLIPVHKNDIVTMYSAYTTSQSAGYSSAKFYPFLL